MGLTHPALTLPSGGGGGAGAPGNTEDPSAVHQEKNATEDTKKALQNKTKKSLP